MKNTIINEWYLNTIEQRTKNEYDEPNFVEVISDCRGWQPLQPDEKMTVTFGHKRYEIKRIV